MRKIKTIIISTSLMLSTLTSLVSGQETVIIKDLSVSFYSNVFEEKRDVKIQHIYLERDSLKQNIPTLLVLDSDALFNLTSSIIEFLELSQEYPPFLIVGLSNTNRHEELVGDSANKFAQFIKEEVDSILASIFPNNGTLSIIGHSNSADFILNKGVENISSACILSGVTNDFEFIKNNFTSYFCYSGEEDYKNRLEFISIVDSIKQLEGSKTNNITIDVFKDRDHFDIPMSGIGSYIKAYFKQYVSLNEVDYNFIKSSENQLVAINQIISDKKQALKINYVLSVEDISVLSEIIDSAHFEIVFKHLLTMNLDEMSVLFTHYFLGDFYEGKTQYKEALTQYELMYNSAPEWVSNKEQLHENIDRVKEKINENEKK